MDGPGPFSSAYVFCVNSASERGRRGARFLHTPSHILGIYQQNLVQHVFSRCPDTATEAVDEQDDKSSMPAGVSLRLATFSLPGLRLPDHSFPITAVTTLQYSTVLCCIHAYRLGSMLLPRNSLSNCRREVERQEKSMAGPAD